MVTFEPCELARKANSCTSEETICTWLTNFINNTSIATVEEIDNILRGQSTQLCKPCRILISTLKLEEKEGPATILRMAPRP